MSNLSQNFFPCFITHAKAFSNVHKNRYMVNSGLSQQIWQRNILFYLVLSFACHLLCCRHVLQICSMDIFACVPCVLVLWKYAIAASKWMLLTLFLTFFCIIKFNMQSIMLYFLTVDFLFFVLRWNLYHSIKNIILVVF